jgi:hypothetical protein
MTNFTFDSLWHSLTTMRKWLSSIVAALATLPRTCESSQPNGAITTATIDPIIPVFSPPSLVSNPLQCYDNAQKKLCGYVQNATCTCPAYPTAAGGTDGFYGFDANATRMIGLYNPLGMGGNEMTYTSDGGKNWKIKKFPYPAAFSWNLYPVNGGKGRRNFGGISQGAYIIPSEGNMTDRSWMGKHSATFSFDSSDELQMETTAPITVGLVGLGLIPLPCAYQRSFCINPKQLLGSTPSCAGFKVSRALAPHCIPFPAQASKHLFQTGKSSRWFIAFHSLMRDVIRRGHLHVRLLRTIILATC